MTLIDNLIHEAFLEVLDTANNLVVTVIELPGPADKVGGSTGMKSLKMQRDQVMKSSTHWVEIDLLREGIPLLLPARTPEHDYLVHVSSAHRRPQGLVWPIRLSQRLPVIPIPLLAGDGDAPLDLQAVLDTAYDHAGYDNEIDYTKEPIPPLKPEWAEWSDRWLREKGFRGSNDAG